jgi:hypothetical protein
MRKSNLYNLNFKNLIKNIYPSCRIFYILSQRIDDIYKRKKSIKKINEKNFLILVTPIAC